MVPALKLPKERLQGDAWMGGAEETVRIDLAPDARSGRARRPRRQANPYVVLPLVGLLLFGAGLALVGQRVQWMNLTYELEAAQRELTALKQTHARLQAAAAGAASLDRMETTARHRLGMVDPGAHAAVVVAPVPRDGTALAQRPSVLAAVGHWLQRRLTTAAEAGERRSNPEP